MDISLSSGEAVFRTPYSEKYNLLQFFRGMKKGTNSFNCPVSFHTAGFQRADHRDIWHVDVALSFATDECVPQVINRECIGANHAWPGGVVVHAPGHDKDLSDVASLWKDEKGLSWTLLRVEDEENLLFVSENIGESKEHFDFAEAVAGTLTYVSHGVHESPISPVSQRGRAQMYSANRYLRRCIYAYKDGVRTLVYGGASGVDYAEIVEEYDIINPSTIADALRARRPAGGYTVEPDLAVGESMLRHNMTYRILSDGTVLAICDHTLLQDVEWNGNMCIMYQEKNDVAGGGVWRVIPTLKPIACGGETFDFSVPYNTTGGPFPERYELTRDTWVNPAFPPDHQLDFIRREGGGTVAAFAGGYLPVFDGEPAVRRENIDSACMLIRTRKTYPNLFGALGKDKRATGRRTSHGVGYRRYFAPEAEGCCVNAYPFEGKTYVVMDFYADAEKVLTYTLPAGAACEVVSCTGVTLDTADGVITGRGSQGSALIAIG